MAHALELVGFEVAAALDRLLVLVALEGRSCSGRLTGWVADEGRTCHRQQQRSCAHGAALGVTGVLALLAVILFEHGEYLEAHSVKVVRRLALVDLAGLVHANDVGQVCGQGA
eukprot:6212213-Pleurochrysis_carterae.AAC.3